MVRSSITTDSSPARVVDAAPSAISVVPTVTLELARSELPIEAKEAAAPSPPDFKN